MDIPVELPLDSSGFLRRECPTCLRQFKWHHGATSGRPEGWVDPSAYHCPLCGERSASDEFMTREQLDHIRASAIGPARQMVADELARAMRGVKGIRYTPGRPAAQHPPLPLVEPDDMQQVASPCHPWEPVKVPDFAPAPFFCLVCGERFSV